MVQDYIDLLGVLATGVIAFATVILVYVTWNLARVSKRKPYVVCFIESSLAGFSFFILIAKNTGNATAFDIEVSITPALPDGGGIQIEGEIETNRKISILAPDQRLSSAVFQIKRTPEDIKENPLKEFNVIISWATKPKGKKRKTISYTMGHIDDFKREWTHNGLHQIHRELKEIKEHFKKFKS